MKVLTEKYPAGYEGTRTAGMYIDGNLKSNLDVLKAAIKQDWDGLILVDGTEGAGKSVLAQQCAVYCDPTLTLDRIVFRPEVFQKAVIKAEKFQAVVYDEAFGGLSSRKTMSETNHAIVSMLTEVRQKNLFLFIVLPTFFDLDRYVALWRSRGLIHVYADRFQRGFFRFYNYKKKKTMYVQGKKFYNYKVVSPDFYGRFADFYPCGRVDYKAKKLNSLSDFGPRRQMRTEAKVRHDLVQEFVRNMHFHSKMKPNQTQIADLLAIGRVTVRNALKSKELDP